MLDVLGAVHRSRGRVRPARPGSDGSLTAVARLVSVEGTTATVSLYGGDPIPGVPVTPSTYTGVTTVNVLLQGGSPVLVTSPAGSGSWAPLAGVTTSEAREVVGRVVAPLGSGSWRTDAAAWDSWNTTGDVFQGTSDSGAGPLLGLAWFGDQFTALGASAITRVTLTLVSNGSGGTFTATMQGSASSEQPAGAPAFTGPTTTVTIPAGGTATVDLGSTTRENLRTGAIASLGLTGATYGGTLGHYQAPSWVLDVDYEVTG